MCTGTGLKQDDRSTYFMNDKHAGKLNYVNNKVFIKISIYSAAYVPLIYSVSPYMT